MKQFYNCSIICTLFKITFLGKWNERGERPFLWPLTSFPDRHTYSVHSVQYCLSFCFEQFCWDVIRNCGMRLAVRWMAQTTSERTGVSSCSQYFCSFPFHSSSQYKSSQYPLPPVCVLCSFSQIFASRWLDTLQTWLKLSIYWFYCVFWKSCLDFPFEFAASSSMHMPSSCCCLSSLSFLCTSAFSSWYRFLSLPFASLFSLIAAKVSSDIHFFFFCDLADPIFSLATSSRTVLVPLKCVEDPWKFLTSVLYNHRYHDVKISQSQINSGQCVYEIPKILPSTELCNCG